MTFQIIITDRYLSLSNKKYRLKPSTYGYSSHCSKVLLYWFNPSIQFSMVKDIFIAHVKNAMANTWLQINTSVKCSAICPKFWILFEMAHFHTRQIFVPHGSYMGSISNMFPPKPSQTPTLTNSMPYLYVRSTNVVRWFLKRTSYF